LQTQAP